MSSSEPFISRHLLNSALSPVGHIPPSAVPLLMDDGNYGLKISQPAATVHERGRQDASTSLLEDAWRTWGSIAIHPREIGQASG